MAYCSDCGSEVSITDSFCPDCGNELSDVSKGSEPESEQVETDSTTTEDDEIDWAKAGKALGFALVPALGAYLGISIAVSDALGIIFWLSIPLFAYLIYQRPDTRSMFGATCFWLSIEAFLTPVIMLVYTLTFVSQSTTTGVEQAGAAIGGFILIVVAFVIGLPAGIVLYLVSSKFDPDDEGE
jgi:hypothetical protein